MGAGGGGGQGGPQPAVSVSGTGSEMEGPQKDRLSHVVIINSRLLVCLAHLFGS